jgi:hypothetical protein
MLNVKRAEVVYDTCVIELDPEVMELIGLPAGALVTLQKVGDGLKAELIPPASEEFEVRLRRLHEKYKDAFAEMKRLGD